MANVDVIKTKADLTDSRWINTPFTYTKFLSGLTLLQQEVMLKVSDSVQEYIRNFYADGRNKAKARPNSLFTSDDKSMLHPIRVYLEDYGISAQNYGLVSEALDQIVKITIKYVAKENGKNILKVVPIFMKGEAPVQLVGDYDNIDDAKKRRLGWAEFHINKEVVDYVFDMREGYITHPDNIARISSKQYTPLLYTMLKHYAGKTGKCDLTVKQIKLHLGLLESEKVVKNGKVEIEEKTTDDPEEMKLRDGRKKVRKHELLPRWDHFKAKVLDKVQTEMQELADKGLMDFTFSYVEHRELNKRTGKEKKTGTPKLLSFTLEYISQPETAPKRGKKKTTMAAIDAHVLAEPQLMMDVEGAGYGQWQKVLPQLPKDILEKIVSAKYIGLHGGFYHIRFKTEAEKKAFDDIQDKINLSHNKKVKDEYHQLLGMHHIYADTE